MLLFTIFLPLKMASASRHVCCCLRQVLRVSPAKRKRVLPSPIPLRSRAHYFSTSSLWREDGPTTRITQAGRKQQEENFDDGNVPKLPEVDPSEYRIPEKPTTRADLDAEERASFDTLTKEEQTEYLGLRNHYQAILEEGAEEELESEELQRDINQLDREMERDFPIEFDNTRVRDNEIGYWAEDEEDEMGVTPDNDDDWDESMITTVAEAELELHREIREYTRVAIWDMPLLQSEEMCFR